MEKFGAILGFLLITMIGLTFLSVFLTFFFHITSIFIQELTIYLHASIFMLGILYTSFHNKHVRIDIFYANHTKNKQKLVNRLGTTLLLLPFFIFLFYVSYGYVVSSWAILESSAEAGGVPFVYGLKTLLLILPTIMVLHSLKSFKNSH